MSDTPKTSYSDTIGPDVAISSSNTAAHNSLSLQETVTEHADDDVSAARAVGPLPPRCSKRSRKLPAWFRDYDTDD